jgi:hypothetical protein
MQGLVALVGHTVRGALSVIHLAVVLVTQVQIAVIGNQLGESVCSFNYAVGMLVEHSKKIAFARQ